MLSVYFNIQSQLAQNQAKLGPKQTDELTSMKLLVLSMKFHARFGVERNYAEGNKEIKVGI